MMLHEEIIQKVVSETDMKSLENGTIEDIERVIYEIMAEALLEEGIEEDENE